MSKTYFISGIDTDCGKTMVAGLLARALYRQGVNVITQKLVQTGCEGIAEDLLEHRKIAGVGLQEVDRQGVTCSYVFQFPASPHLAARMENQQIECNQITEATMELEKVYDIVLLEGAGGLLVPLNDDFLTIDYMRQTGHPLILVSSSKLGSINHTLMSLEVCLKRDIEIKALVYNHLPGENEMIASESLTVFAKYIAEHCPETQLIECPEVDEENYPELDVDWI